MSRFNSRYSNTSVFLLRPVEATAKEETLSTSKITHFGFLDAFLQDADSDVEYQYPVYLLFKQKDFVISFQEFIEEEYEKGFLIDDYDYPDGYVVLVYSCPEKYRKDYDKVVQGKYSQTSADYQDLFHREVKDELGQRLKSLQFQVFTKDVALRQKIEAAIGAELPKDSEVWLKPVMERETLKIENYQLKDKV